VTDLEKLRALAEQFGVPGVDLNQVVILCDDLDLIPREVCDTHRILPILVRAEHVFLAMANPGDTRVIDEIEFVTGKKVYPYAALAHELAATILAAHDAKNRHAPYYVAPNVPAARLLELGLGTAGAATPAEKLRVKSSSGFMRSVVAPIVTPLIPPALPVEAQRPTDSAEVERDVSTVAPVENAPDVRGSGGRYSSTAKLILVVDDEEDIRTMLKRVLTSQGHRVIDAENGPLALQMVKQHVPDLLILDAMLPGLHGFDVARRLKASERYGAIPIIMISAVYRGWRVVEDLKTSYGIFDYLEKPFRLTDVVEAAARALTARASERETSTTDLDLLSADAAKALDDGIAAYRAGDIDGAIELLKSGTKLDPLAYRLHFHLALLYGKKDQVFEGIGELEIAVELNPKHFPALKNLALLYERAGFKNRAVEMWERCVHTAPDALSKAQVKERLVALL
jgi:DNA-binding response OmpR family regulator